MLNRVRIEGHTFLVTGGASGLGAACARMFVESGGRVVIADLNAEAGAAMITELGASAQFIPTDVTGDEDVRAAVTAAIDLSSGEHLRGLVNCAGIAPAGRVLDREGEPHSLDLFRKVIEVNLIGTFNAVRHAAVAMAKNLPLDDGERGVIINTASIAAFEGQVGQAAYAASKGGVASMTLPLARELARHGIRVAAIAPGIFETPMMARMPEKVRVSLAAAIPFPPRLGRPEEFARLARHIIENPMLNGTTIRLDGAMRMAGK